jgi:cytochrome P450
MLSGRTYIVADPALCAAVQKASTVLNFDPIVVAVIPRVVGLNAHTMQVIKGPPDQKYEDGIMKASHHIINTPLLPQNIKDASKTQLEYFAKCIASIQDGSNIDLYRFVRDTVTTATQNTFFGPNNPFENDPELVESFWDWEAGLIPYMVGVFPKIFARKATRGIDACVDRFKQYIEADGFKGAHKILKDRQTLHRSNGLTDKDELARLEVSISLGLVINASVTTFWVIDQVFSRPALLSKIREEIHANALVGLGRLSVERLRTSCPRLMSAFRETMRLCMPAISARFVAEDIILADTWLLRKGAVVQLAGNVIHFDPEIWGPDCDTFNPDRFLYSPNGSKSNPDGTVSEGKAHYVHPSAFRSFGGGSSLCPGKLIRASYACAY